MLITHNVKKGLLFNLWKFISTVYECFQTNSIFNNHLNSIYNVNKFKDIFHCVLKADHFQV